MPKMSNKIPTIILKYFKKVDDLLIKLIACEVNNPTNKNGMPKPSA